MQKPEGNSSSQHGHLGCLQYFPFPIYANKILTDGGTQIDDRCKTRSEVLETSLGTLGWNRTFCKHYYVVVAYSL